MVFLTISALNLLELSFTGSAVATEALHNPELSEKSLAKAIQGARVSYEELNKILKKVPRSEWVIK